MPQQLASFPGPKTGRGYSAIAVVLDCSQALPSSPLLFCSRVLGGACEQVVSRDYLSSCTCSSPCFLSCPGLTQPVFFLLCCFNGTARYHVPFYVSLLGSSICGLLHGSLQEHDCAISTTPKASLCELPYQLPLRFTLGTWL